MSRRGPQASAASTGWRMRVVYLDHCAQLSGGELAMSRLLPWLRDDVDPLVVLGEHGDLVGELERSDIPVLVLPMAGAAREVRKDTVVPGGVGPASVLATLVYVVRLARLLRRLRPDLVHTNSLKAALYGGVAGRLAGVPVLWHVRDRIASDYLPRPAVSLVRMLSRVLPRAVVANSHATLATLPPEVTGAVVLNPVVHESVHAPPAVRAEHPALRIGVLGRLAPWKGQHVFLEAFARAFGEGEEEARLIGSAMFGEEDYERRLQEQVAELGLGERVVFRGFQPDIWSELAELDVLVHCSVTPEPFGQVVLEGMAAGLPVLASNEGGPPEVITHGVDGLLVRPDDPEELARVLAEVASDAGLRRRLGDEGRLTAARHGPRDSASKVVTIYRQVLTNRRQVSLADVRGFVRDLVSAGERDVRAQAPARPR